MNRREFLGAMAAAPMARAAQPSPRRRRFEITTRLEFPGVRGKIVAWVPVPYGRGLSYQSSTNPGSALSGLSQPKYVHEEKPGASLDDPYIVKARTTLFGSWEMNWFAYNDAHDVVLPGSKGKPLPFLMYPQAEIDGVRRDSLDPSTFKYTIDARQV